VTPKLSGRSAAGVMGQAPWCDGGVAHVGAAVGVLPSIVAGVPSCG